MTTCAYCEQPATVKIPSNPAGVCVSHAVEFWGALFEVVKDRAIPVPARPVPCSCIACNDLTAARALGIEAALWPQSPGLQTSSLTAN